METTIKNRLSSSRNEIKKLKMAIELPQGEFEEIITGELSLMRSKNISMDNTDDLLPELSKKVYGVIGEKSLHLFLEKCEKELPIYKKIVELGPGPEAEKEILLNFGEEIEEAERQRGREVEVLANNLSLIKQMGNQVSERIKTCFLKVSKT